jgi:phenylpropionate dioxygenase-like ring-hydroxylating dioxygenase large terminal subunit
MPLSAGAVEGEIIRCCYHGLEFDVTGTCTRVPGQDRVPSQAFVRSYPLVERDAVLWIWMGAAEAADATKIPAHPWHVDPAWGWSGGAHFMVDGNWTLIIDNVMDASHLGYVHAKTIGGDPNLHFRTKTEATREADRVTVTRHMPRSVAPPTYRAAMGFTGPIDRWQELCFKPVLIQIHTGACDADTGAFEGRREHGFSMMGFHGITPETETTTHYFWSVATNVGLDRGIPDLVFEQTAETFREDQVVLAAQQKRLGESPGGKFVDTMNDVGANHARRLIRAFYEAEQMQAVAAE